MNERQTQYAFQARAIETAILGLEYRHVAMVEREDPPPLDITGAQWAYLQMARDAIDDFVKLFPQ